jgi:prophage tail gpP-like protein
MTPDQLALTVDGQRYTGWTEMRVSRGVDRCASNFDISVTEAWAVSDNPWRIRPFSPCQIQVGNDNAGWQTVLTGYVEAYMPTLGAGSHGVRVRGRSKTGDLIECTPDIASGQFAGYTVAAICKSICAIFGIGVVVQTDAANVVVANTNMERCETAFTFLERLCRLAGVLASDDPDGNLLLTRAGSARAAGRLAQGENLLSAHAVIDVKKQFSNYIIKGQTGIGIGTSSTYAGAGGIGYTPAPTQGAKVQTQQKGQAVDTAVPRYRPHVSMAESQLSAAGITARAKWQRNFAFGQATKLHWTLPGWRQPDGSLWQPNQLVPVTSSYMSIDQDLLVARWQISLDASGGHITTLELGPIEGYTPDPGQVKLHKHRGKKGRGIDWHGANDLDPHGFNTDLAKTVFGDSRSILR